MASRSEPTSEATALAILGRVAQVLSQASDLASLCRGLFQEIAKAMPCDALAVALRDEATGETSWISLLELADGQMREIPGAESIPIPPLESGAARDVQIIHRDEGENAEKSVLQRSRSIVRARLGVGEETAGLIEVHSLRSQAHDRAHADLLQTIARTAAPALSRWQVDAAYRRMRDRVAVFHQVEEAIAETIEISTLGRRLAEALRNVVPCDALLILFHDETKGVFRGGVSFDTVDGALTEFPQEPGFEMDFSAYEHIFRSGRPTLTLRGAGDDLPRVEAHFGASKQISRSIANVPLTKGERIIGVLSVQSYRVDAYAERDLPLFDSIGRQVALALDNAALFAQVQERLARSRAIQRIAQTVAEELDLETTLSEILEATAEAVPHDAFFIARHAPGAHAVEVLVSSDRTEGAPEILAPGSRMPLAGSFCEQAITTRRALRIHRAPAEADLPPEVNAFGNRRRRSLSLMFAPLIAGDDVLGVIGVQSYAENAFSPGHLETLEAIARQVAMALRRIELDAKVRASEQRLRTIFDEAPLSIILLDASGAVVDVNRWHLEHAEPLGRREDHIGMRLTEPSAHVSADLAASVEACLRGRPFEMPVHRVAPSADQPARFMHVQGHPLRDCDQRVVGALILQADITERERLQFDLLQAQKMESIGRLAGGIAHDFNNILVGILGAVSVVKPMVEDHAEVRDFVEMIEQGAERAADLTRQLLAYARTGRSQTVPVDLNRLIGETLHLIRSTLPPEVEVRSELAEDLLRVDADPNQMQHVLLNLLTNAAEAMPRGGRLSVITQNVRPFEVPASLARESPRVAMVKVQIQDTGEGIPLNLQERVFEPFFSTKATGRGLGLAAVSGLVRGHQGHVDFTSTPGEGSTFTLWLPAKEEASAETAPLLSVAESEAHECILLIDDDEIVRRMGTRMLGRLGYRVLVAESGARAVEILREHGEEIALALVDLVMPEMGGLETLRRLREVRPGIRTLLSSGYDDPSDASMFSSEGFRGFIHKPYRLENLSHALRQALQA
jgi:PAS domain S-box-containing protein